MKKTRESQTTQIVVVLGLVGYLAYLAYRNGGSFKQLPGGYRVKIDPGLAANLIAQPLRDRYPYAAHFVQFGSESLLKRLSSKMGIESSTL